MTAQAARLLEEVKKLAPNERREFVEKAMESMETDDFALTSEQLAELDARLDEAERNPRDGMSLEVLKRRISERTGTAWS